MTYVGHKFSSELAERLYSEGEPAEQIGSVDELGWFGMYFNDSEAGEGFGGQILTEDSNGFVTVWEFDSETALVKEWSDIEADYAEYDTANGYDETEFPGDRLN